MNPPPLRMGRGNEKETLHAHQPLWEGCLWESCCVLGAHSKSSLGVRAGPTLQARSCQPPILNQSPRCFLPHSGGCRVCRRTCLGEKFQGPELASTLAVTASVTSRFLGSWCRSLKDALDFVPAKALRGPSQYDKSNTSFRAEVKGSHWHRVTYVRVSRVPNRKFSFSPWHGSLRKPP